MSEYRLYCLNEAGNFGKVHEFEAASDEEAMKEARGLKLPTHGAMGASPHGREVGAYKAR